MKNYLYPSFSNFTFIFISVLQMRFVVTMLVVGCALPAMAQLVVSSGQSAQQLAQTIVGTGVSVNNAVLNCTQGGSGLFDGTSSNIGLNSGILLTSGVVNNAVGPNLVPDRSYPDPFTIVACDANTGDAQLQNIVSPQTTFDACILEFDVVPLGNTLSFRYVFASEEYPEYVCSDYNDVFAFFISGPGIAGSQNIALIPGTSIPVAINSINSGSPGSSCGPIPFLCGCTSLSYSMYYVNNNNGATVEYDGFTRVLTARANVIPCETYRLRLAIADVGDCIYDSGVFIEEGSLNSNVPVVSQTTSDVYEGCRSGFIDFSIPAAQTSDIVVRYAIGGSATNGIDYQWIPDSVVIPAGQTTARLNIVTLPDTVNDPIETLELYLYILVCDTLFYDTASVLIREEVPVLNARDTTICRGEQPQLNVSGGVSYQWIPATGLSDPTIPNPIFIGDTTTGYIVVIYDTNNCRGRGFITVYVQDPPSPVYNPDYYICAGDSVLLSVSGGATYLWSPSVGLSNAGIATPWASPLATTTYNVSVSVGSCVEIVQITVHVSNAPLVSAGNDTLVCKGSTITLQATGGDSYSWSPAGSLNNPHSATPVATVLATTTYTVTATNGAGCTATASVTIIATDPQPISAGSDITKCREDTVTLQVSGGSAHSWSPTLDILHPNSPNPLVFPSNDTEYIVTALDDNGCLTSDSIWIMIVPVESVDAGPDRSVCLGEQIVIGGSPTAPADYDIVWSAVQGSLDALSSSTAANPVFYSNQTGAGTYVYQVRGNYLGCEAGTDEVIVTVYPLPIADFSGLDSIFCVEHPGATLTGMPPGGTFSGTGIINNTFYPSVAGVGGSYAITYAVTDTHGCFDDTTKTTRVIQFTTNAGDDQVISIYDSVRLNPAAGAVIYEWSPATSLSCSVCMHPYASPTITTTYTLLAIDENGCTAYDDVTVEVIVDTLLWVPNAFSPDGNLVNDVFRVYGKNIKSIDLKIFNRWGELLFQAHDPNEGWDGTYQGKAMITGVYVYVVQATFINEAQSKTLKGSFLLLR